jgi:ribonuclease P protein component
LERLRRRTDFRAAATGARASAKAFVVQARRRAEDGPVRVGFTVSKQVGNAVERNRVRRRLREIVRLSGGAALRPGHDYVLIGRRAALRMPFLDMRQDLDTAVGRIHSGHGAGGTGSDRSGALHDAGSPGRSRAKARRTHRPQQSQRPSPASPARSPDLPPHER